MNVQNMFAEIFNIKLVTIRKKIINKSCFNPFTVSNQHSPDKEANDQAADFKDLITCLIIVTFVKVKSSNWR